MRIFREKPVMMVGICLIVIGVAGMVVRSYTVPRVGGEADTIGILFGFIVCLGIPFALYDYCDVLW